MNHSESSRSLSSPKPSARQRIVRGAAIAMMSVLSMGLIGCASSQPVYQLKEMKHGEIKAGKAKHAHHPVKVKADYQTMACSGTFLAPIHDAQKNFPLGLAVPFSVTARWTTSGGCTFGGGKLSVYLVKNGQAKYCASATLPATSANTKTVNFSCTANSSSTGIHALKCYVTGTLSDGTIIPPWSPSDFPISSHCP